MRFFLEDMAGEPGAPPMRGTLDSTYLSENELHMLKGMTVVSGLPSLTNLASLCAERRKLRQVGKRNALRGAVLEDMVTTLERRPYSRKAVAACVERAKEVLAAGAGVVRP